MTLAYRLRQLLQHLVQLSKPDLETAVRLHWDRRAIGQKSIFHLREFEDDMWRRNLRLAGTPFDHHLAMMQLFKKEVAPRLEPAPQARRSSSVTASARLG